MTDFLARLLGHSRDGAPGIVRRRPSMFEPTPDAAPGMRRPDGSVTAASAWADGREEVREHPAERAGGATVPAADPSLRPSAHPLPSGPETPGGRLLARDPAAPAEPPRTGSAEGGRPGGELRRPAFRAELEVGAGPRPAEPRAPLPRPIETITEVPAPASPTPQRPPAPSRAPEPPVARRPGVPQEPHVVPAIALRQRDEAGADRDPSARGRRPAPRVAETASLEHTDGPSVRPMHRQPPAAGPPAGAGRSPTSSAPPAPAPPAPPAIHVTIGRIEVRATPPKSPAAAAVRRPSPPKLGLDEYLRSRSGRAV